MTEQYNKQCNKLSYCKTNKADFIRPYCTDGGKAEQESCTALTGPVGGSPVSTAISETISSYKKTGRH